MGLRTKQHYHDYAELTALMEQWAESSPLCSLSSIGTSQEGRELWLMTLTDESTGAHDTKPAFWCEANTHSGEITGTEAALHLIDTLVTAHEADEDGTGPISQLFKTSTVRDLTHFFVLACSSLFAHFSLTVCSWGQVYVLPRITPDGAELFLKTPHSCALKHPSLLLHSHAFSEKSLVFPACALPRSCTPDGTTSPASSRWI